MWVRSCNLRCKFVCTYCKSYLVKPQLLISCLLDMAKLLTVVTDLCLSLSRILLHCMTRNVNVAGMSWPVWCSEVATLAQDILEGLAPQLQCSSYPQCFCSWQVAMVVMITFIAGFWKKFARTISSFCILLYKKYVTKKHFQECKGM